MLPELTIVPMREFDTVAGGTAAFGAVDTKGYDFVKCIYLTQKTTSTTAQDFCDLGESDTLLTAVTTANQIAGCDATAGDFTLGLESSTFSNAAVYNVDLKGRKRYIGMKYESDGTHLGCMIALLGRREDGVESTVATTAHGVRGLKSV